MATENGDAEKTVDQRGAVAGVATGIRDQSLVIEGWFASHADRGTPGPHLHLRTNDGRDAVLRTTQIPAVVDALSLVAKRIDDLWASDGQEYTDQVLRHSPDPNDPETIRQERIRHLDFTERVSAHLPDLMTLLQRAQSTDEALISIAALLDVDEVDVMAGLARFDLLGMTRAAGAARKRRLANLKDE